MHDGVCSSLATLRRRLLALIPLAMLLAGCGTEQYEARLANTAILFAHEELLREHLQGKWSDAENGIDLRVPLKFELLPPPVKPEPKEKPAGEEGETTEEEEVEIIDDRQPKYVNVELPGLRGAFRADVKVLAENNVEVQGDAWIYVISNQDMADRLDEAKEFNRSFVKALASALEQPVDEQDWREEYYPPKRNPDTPARVFVTPVRFSTITVKPDRDLAGFTRQFSLYLYELGDVQVTILFVLPQNVDGSEKLTQRIPLCLETLKVSGGALVHKSPGSVGGGAPPKEGF